MKNILYNKNSHKEKVPKPSKDYNKDQVKKVLDFHRTLPGYNFSTLFSLKNMSHYLGVEEIQVKDESSRFGLNAFKGLGSSYAMATLMAKTLSTELNFSLIKEKLKAKKQYTFASATAGNHGRGLAWSAKLFGQTAEIYLPKGSSLCKKQRIEDLGAKCYISDLGYDDAVRYVSAISQKNQWHVIQDTSWEGYKEIPLLIMQGYLTIVGEYINQLQALEWKSPTHVIVQAGVGSLAGAIVGSMQQYLPDTKFIIVEPVTANCMYQSSLSRDGNPVNLKGDTHSIMSGLACAEANPEAWNILKNKVDYFVSCTDSLAEKGMRVLGSPIKDDPRIISGESGAVPMGFLFEVCHNPEYREIKEKMGFDKSSRVFFINTEGDTDPENYRKVCWGE